MKHTITFLSAFALAIVMLVGNVFAQVAPYTLFGTSGYIESDFEEDMAVQLISGADSYGGIDFDIPENSTFADLKHISTDFAIVSGTCGGGSPRFQIDIVDPITNIESTVYAYIGEGPAYTCSSNHWQKSGNILEKGRFIDATHAGGLFYTPYEEVLTYFGNRRVTALELVLDSGWMFGDQSIVVDNIQINDQVFTFPLKD